MSAGFEFAPEQWWNEQVCQWKVCFYMSIGASDADLVRHFSPDVSEDDVARIRADWNAIVEMAPELGNRPHWSMP